MKIVIGSRGSKLALWQAGWVRDRLVARGFEAEIRAITTTGDKLASVALTNSGTKGLFIKEIEEALIARDIDVAVHSLKDLPTDWPEGLYVAAVPPREDARDVLVSQHNTSLTSLSAGARVGTGSLRRHSQIRALRPDLLIEPVRGNVDTRIRKLDEGGYDALVMAAAGLYRLGLAARVTEYFDPCLVCPAAGQGALALEARRDDLRIEDAIRPLDDRSTHQAVLAERAALRALGGGCQTPTAAYAQADGDTLHLTAVVATVDGATILRASAAGPSSDPEGLGASVSGRLLSQGAGEILVTNREAGE